MKKLLLLFLLAFATLSHAQNTILRINSGGPTVTNGTETWVNDQYFTGGATYSTSQAIGNTTQDNIYQTERFGNVSYKIPVSSGTYRVNLHFAEIYWNVSNSRLFNVAVENQFTRNGIDIFALYGSFNAATITADNIIVTDGSIDITLSTVNS